MLPDDNFIRLDPILEEHDLIQFDCNDDEKLKRLKTIACESMMANMAQIEHVIMMINE